MKSLWRLAVILTSLILLEGSFLSTRGEEPLETARSSFTLAQVLGHIEAKAKTLKSLKGNFHQFKQTRLLVAPIESEGAFYWKPPDHFRWEVARFIPFTLVARGDTVLLHYSDLNRASLFRHPMGDNLLGKITGTAGDTEAFKRAYHLSLTPPREPEAQQWVQLGMEPRSSRQARHLKRIDVTIDPATWLPRWITILGTNEDKTTIRLSELVENAEIPESLFSVKPPEGVQLQQMQGGRRP